MFESNIYNATFLLKVTFAYACVMLNPTNIVNF